MPRSQEEIRKDINYDESKVPVFKLPSPLERPDGGRVTTAYEWVNRRRGEVLDFYKKEVYGQMKQNPNVQLVAIKDGCRDWIRISGKAEECQDIETKTKMFEACPVLEKHYGTPQCEFLAVFKIKVDEAELSDKDGVNKID